MSFLLPTNEIRKDFPILDTKVHGKPLVYVDNAATTHKPQVVIDSLVNYYQTLNSNIHRGIHYLSEAATQEYEAVREKVRAFVNARNTCEIIFTRNATEAINLVARSWGETNVKAGDEIVLSQLEHHSNLIPWQMLATKTGATLKFIPVDKEGQLDLSNLDQLITNKTKIVAFTLMSNVLGTMPPADKIIKRAKAVGAVTLCDASQYAAHAKTDVQALDCDFLVFSAHKMCGPTGVGVLYGKEAILNAMPPFLGGGEMISHVEWDKATWNVLPSKFEAGTPNIADVIAFGPALDYLNKIGLDKIHEHEMTLTQRLLDGMAANPNVILFGPKTTENRGGVVSFELDHIHPHDIGTVLDFEGIAIRAGHHCAQPLMSVLGVPATARVSFYFYNTPEEVDMVLRALEKANAYFHRPVKTNTLPQTPKGQVQGVVTK
ncbi:MAG: cysteine desulfurase [Deltaproteobacteria bacterium CG11_big_fil_rev_8_21_14_0_20_47_16]|nr:MAG: cysteine desulfurase [Deltaproteobacteria bacterium CG11_big_fil_rev_8_21_14_0_20_47_16]